MSSISEILQALETMPDDKKAELEAQANQAIDLKWIPNPGPQTEAFYCKADELFFGGSAGGGKSALIVGLSQTSHERSLILRRFRDDAKELAETELIDKSLDGDRNGWNGADLIYRGKGHITTFGGCQAETDKQRYKGKPHDLKCVGEGTPVLMGNGSYKPIQDIAAGDMVATLEGAKKVIKSFLTPTKAAVKLSVSMLDGTIVHQIQSASHEILTRTGWVVPDMSSVSCLEHQTGLLSSGFCVSDTTSSISSSLSLSILPDLDKLNVLARNILRPLQAAKLDLDCLTQQGSLYGKVLQAQEICYEEFDDRLQAHQQQALFPQVSLKFLSLKNLAFSSDGLNSSLKYDGFDVQKKSLPVGFLDHCRFLFRSCGAHILELTGLRAVLVVGQQYLRQPICVEQHSPIGLLDGGAGRAPTHNHHKWSYCHPYTKEKRQSTAPRSFLSYKVTPVSSRKLFDLEVEEVNHFITKGGIVNKNCFDEVSDFLESQYEFIIAWNRTTTKGQRCRVVSTGNPPTTAEGLWVVRRWAAWLDPSHHNPAKSGELRWFTRDEEGKEIEVEGRGPHIIGEREVFAKSRTFIRAGLSDNPDLALDGQYEAMLSQLPKELRDAYRDGKFDVALKDGAFQTIPTNWIRAAQARWTEKPPEGVPMCAIGVDVAQGGEDNTVLAPRHDGWYAPFITIPGKLTPDGKSVAGLVVANRRDNAKVIIDMGGGYGGAAYEHMKDNNIEVKGYKGAEGYSGRTSDRQLKLYNTRSAAYWKFREALDPSQPGGSTIMLPDDPEMVADLTAPTYAVTRQGIQVEPKKDVVKRLGRSPDIGDAVVMAWWDGLKGANIQGGFKKRNTAPVVVMSKRARIRKR